MWFFMEDCCDEGFYQEKTVKTGKIRQIGAYAEFYSKLKEFFRKNTVFALFTFNPVNDLTGQNEK